MEIKIHFASKAIRCAFGASCAKVMVGAKLLYTNCLNSKCPKLCSLHAIDCSTAAAGSEHGKLVGVGGWLWIVVVQSGHKRIWNSFFFCCCSVLGSAAARCEWAPLSSSDEKCSNKKCQTWMRANVYVRCEKHHRRTVEIEWSAYILAASATARAGNKFVGTLPARPRSSVVTMAHQTSKRSNAEPMPPYLQLPNNENNFKTHKNIMFEVELRPFLPRNILCFFFYRLFEINSICLRATENVRAAVEHGVWPVAQAKSRRKLFALAFNE